MARVQLLLCFIVLLASVTVLDLVSAHLNYKPTLPQIEGPKTVKDVEPYTIKVVTVFVADLEKQCPKTSKFKAFFEKIRGFAKYVCPIKRKDQAADYDRDMQAKAGGIVRLISSFAIGRIKREIQEENLEMINTFKFMRFLGSKILGGRKKEESEDTMKLTAEQQKEIKEGILRWETIITKVTNTMVMSSTNSSSDETSAAEKNGSSGQTKSSFLKDTTGSSGESKSSGSGSSSFNGKASFEDTTGSSSDMGSPSGSPSSSPSGSSSSEESKSETSSTKSNGGSSVSGNVGASQSSSSQSSSSQSQSSSVTVQQVEAETSKEVTTFLMNLEKKCPQKEEYKAFFTQLKGTMTAPRKQRQGLFSRLKAAAGKVSGAMSFIRSRIGGKSAEVKKSLETYQGEVMKTLQELETIHSQIMSQNKGKREGSLKCTPQQQAQIKTTITKWEKVTTQFVETAAQSETQSSSSSSSSASSSVGKLMPN